MPFVTRCLRVIRGYHRVASASARGTGRAAYAVLIGRLPTCEAETLELEQSRFPDVQIVTYGEILQQQKMLVSCAGLTSLA